MTPERAPLPTEVSEAEVGVEAAEPLPAAFPEPRMPGFLPYPNEGRAAFEARYRDWSPDELRSILESFRAKIDEEARELLKERIASGDVAERADAQQAGMNEAPNAGSPPIGQGRVWACTQAEPIGGGVRVKTAYLTETRDPQLFAHMDELVWIIHKTKALEEGSKK